ncbi:hypothetical protein BMF94_5105 [Rhodotorula taiwanensis]|uniref:Uncharacterized protein n=1 Tax=Rhodotorula taiwanensis TaxID=741276 RepID=A0A2S5B4P2_9BASI|nr:hypothetical protein BMF94_5105 [Rhodotorula taiwanensis]
MSVPGYILSLDGVPATLQADETYLRELLTPHEAVLWCPYTSLPGKIFVLFETDVNASNAHGRLHLTPLPLPHLGHIHTAIVGQPEIALPQAELKTLVDRLASMTAEAEPDQPETAGGTAAGPARDGRRHRRRIRRGIDDRRLDLLERRPCLHCATNRQYVAFDFRLRGIEVAPGCEMSKSFVRRILEQSIDPAWLDDISARGLR